MTEPQPFLTYTDVAALFGVHRETVRRMVNRGELPRVRIGGSVRFRREDVLALVREDDDAPGRARRVETAVAIGSDAGGAP